MIVQHAVTTNIGGSTNMVHGCFC